MNHLRDMPAVATPENSWELVTTRNAEVRDGPVVKRIGVPGGFLYITCTTYGREVHASAPTFVTADRT